MIALSDKHFMKHTDIMHVGQHMCLDENIGWFDVSRTSDGFVDVEIQL